MEKTKLEKTPVVFNKAAVKVLRLKRNTGEKAFSMHWHDRIELIRMRKGKLNILTANEQGVICADEVWIIPPKAPHGAYALEDTEYDVLMFDVRNFYNESEICKNFLPAIFEGRACFKLTTDDFDFLKCYDGICLDFTNPTLNTVAEIYRLIFYIYDKCMVEIKNKVNYTAVKEIIEYIEENFSQKLEINQIAKEFGYCTAHFYRKFKAATGLPPTQYIKIFRLEQARKLLEMGESVTQAAEACGFDDANYFTRCFKAHFGITPSKARKAI